MKLLTSQTPEETRQIAANFVQGLEAPALIRLHGDLGAGKTCFVQGMAEALGWTRAVTSPTYGLVQEFGTSPPFIHADLYRLSHPHEIWALGLDEWMEEAALIAVEWSERVPNFWPADAWHVELTATPGAETQRQIRIWQGARI
jgi:tRNA threonylcarbamoyladenosine biosynthesis protein TsaE